MDQRRVISFLLVSFAIVMFISALMPQPPAPKKPAQPAAGAGAAAENGEKNEGAEAVAEQDQEKQAVPNQQAPKQGDVAAVADLNAPVQYFTIGSLDPATGQRMMVTLSNVGAVVQRAELASPRYTDQHDRAGYLGELELSPIDGGAKVQAVGAGTPAAAAQIAPGDVIVAMESDRVTPIGTAADLRAALSHTKPDQQITLQVRRGEAAPQAKSVKLIRRPFAVVRPEIENYWMREDKPPADFVDRPSLLFTLSTLGDKQFAGDEIAEIQKLLDDGKDISPQQREKLEAARRMAKLLEEGNWQAKRLSENSVEFTRPLQELGVELVKRYTLEPVPTEKIDDVNYPGYDLRFDISIRNTGGTPQKVAYRLDGPTGMPTEGWWYGHKISQHWATAGLRDVSMRFEGGDATQFDGSTVAQGKVQRNENKPVLYAGVDGQYFSAVLVPQGEPPNHDWFQSADAILIGPKPDKKTPLTFANVTSRLVSRSISLEAGETKTHSYRVFMGPKRPDLLENYHPSAEPKTSLVGLIYYGWFGGVANAMLWILHFFYGIIGNYGISIVMLTVLVRGAMFPLSIKQTRNMARMQELKPEMDRINEKYKNDMQKRSQATQELYRKNNINPLGGCLPMLLQFPVFIGLYRALMIDVELRNSPLLGSGIRWCSNLAAPDMLLDWSSIMPAWFNQGMSMMALGPYLNVLPIVTVSLFLVTQKMTNNE